MKHVIAPHLLLAEDASSLLMMPPHEPAGIMDAGWEDAGACHDPAHVS